MPAQVYVTAVMTCYNDKEYVGLALDSLLKQSRVPDSILVLDDCSTDGSFELVQEYARTYKQIEVHQNQVNQGTVATRNKLLELVPPHTDFVVILDSDDISLPQRIEIELDYLEQNPDKAGCTGAMEIIDTRGVVIGEKVHSISGNISRYALCWNPFVQSAMMLRWSDWQEVGEYDSSLKRGEDHEMWLRMLSRGMELGVLTDIVVQYRVHPAQGKWAQSQESMRSYARVRARYLFKAQFFSSKALGITLAYWVASLVPGSVMIWIYKNIYARKK